HHDLWERIDRCCLGQLAPESVKAHVVGARIDVDEVDVSPTIAGAVGRSDERVGARPQPIAGSQSEGQAGDVQGRCRAIYCNRMLGTTVSGDSGLETGDRGALRQPVRTQYFSDCVDIVVADVLAAIGNVPGVQWRPIFSRLASIHFRSSSMDIHSRFVSDA